MVTNVPSGVSRQRRQKSSEQDCRCNHYSFERDYVFGDERTLPFSAGGMVRNGAMHPKRKKPNDGGFMKYPKKRIKLFIFPCMQGR